MNCRQLHLGESPLLYTSVDLGARW